jgi:acylphosphatase
MKKHLNITIYGRVIGVGFRWSVRKAAGKYHISGFVRNVRESYLYIEAEGEQDQLEKFLAWCRKGPLWAKVESVETQEAELENFNEFEIKK